MNLSQRSCSPKSSHNTGRKPSSALFFLLGIFLCAFIAALAFGSTALNWKEVFQGGAAFRIFYYLRLPRALGAALAGGSLAVAGVLIQAVLQNPMAAPNIIGVNGGAGFTAVLLMALAPESIGLLPPVAFLGALGACLLIYALANRTGLSKLGITLVGIAVNSILTAGISTLKTLFPDSLYDANAFAVGSLNGLTYPRILPAMTMILLGLGAALLLARPADVLSLGEDSARALGLPLERTRFFILITAALLAGSAVSFGGLLGFVGLLVPHIIRRWVGTEHRFLIPAAALGGGILVLISDLAGRVLFAPYELPVGILLSLLGGPFFIYLVLKKGAHTK